MALGLRSYSLLKLATLLINANLLSLAASSVRNLDIGGTCLTETINTSMWITEEINIYCCRQHITNMAAGCVFILLFVGFNLISVDKWKINSSLEEN